MFTVDFRKLPKTLDILSLYLDYISPLEPTDGTLWEFFNAGYKDDSDFQKVIGEKIQNYNTNRHFDRNALVEILKLQNVSFGGTDKTAQNIEMLKDDNTFAVVTGQQAALYTGNLYTILKALTAVKLSDKLKQKFPDTNFVPVFWLESEDHDFAESNHIHIVNKQNELVRIGYPQTQEEDESKVSLRPVGSITFDRVITELNEQLRTNLNDSEFKSPLLEKISEIYKEGNDFKHAFAQFMNQILGGFGIVFIDPSSAEIKKLLTPVFEKELMSSPKMCESIIHTSAELEKNYDLQLKPKVINLFYIHNGSRYLIEPRENGRHALRNSKRRFEPDELMNTLQESPENFSPNVVLRPVCQDYLLPTIAYVGGPAEISYMAQLKPAYEHYEITMPVIYPRVSATILESRINKFLENYELNFEDVFHQKTLVGKVVEKLSEIKIEDEISKTQDEFNKIFYELRNVTSKIDKTLIKTQDNIKEKLNANLDLFKGKLINAQAQKNETGMKQIEKVTNILFPERHLQERIINVAYFLNKYDKSFIEKLFSEIDIEVFQHQVIEV